jgi:hypothetical protein
MTNKKGKAVSGGDGRLMLWRHEQNAGILRFTQNDKRNERPWMADA